MNKQAYKLAFDKMEPDAGMRERLEERVARQRAISARPGSGRRRNRTLAAAVAGSVVIAAGIGVFAYGVPENGAPDSSSPPPTAGVSVDRADGAVYVPKLELPKQSNAAMMDMIGLIVYQGRIYTQTSSRVAPEVAKSVLGEKIGRSIGNISEWSSQDEFAKEFASTIGEQDVYTVKGYDREFRLMTYFVDENGQVWSEFYECLNGISLATGADLFQKLRINGQVQAANWENFDSWNYNKEQYKPILLDDGIVEQFVDALYDAQPVEYEKLNGQGMYDNASNDTRKFVLLKLQDQTELRLDLFAGGYVRYGHAQVFFKVDEPAFVAMWDKCR